jgi:hypothetical protein
MAKLFDELVDAFYKHYQSQDIDYETALIQADSLTEVAVQLANWNNQVGKGGIEQYIENDYMQNEGCNLLDICEDAMDQDDLPNDTKKFFERFGSIVDRSLDAEDTFEADCQCTCCGTEFPDWAKKPREKMYLKELDDLTHEYYALGDDVEEHFETYLRLLKEQGATDDRGKIQSV